MLSIRVGTASRNVGWRIIAALVRCVRGAIRSTTFCRRISGGRRASSRAILQFSESIRASEPSKREKAREREQVSARDGYHSPPLVAAAAVPETMRQSQRETSPALFAGAWRRRRSLWRRRQGLKWIMQIGPSCIHFARTASRVALGIKSYSTDMVSRIFSVLNIS
jgi:hypothetical protein